MNWTSGYVTEIDYPHGYYRELAPSSMALAATVAGVSTAIGERPLRYLELGCGQGLSLNVHAAAGEGEFWGTDFNPAQARNAQHLAAAAGSGARIFDASFEELLDQPDLPEFDVIALHGTWSWVSAENRATIVDLVRRKLGVGGVLYISYNCQPGWSVDMPLRQLMAMHAERAGTSRALPQRIDEALAFAQSLADAGSGYFRAHPSSVEWLKRVHTQGRNYLAHEYFNRDWQPMYFAEVAQAFTEAKLTFAGTATLLDPVQRDTLPEPARKLLSGITDPLMHETAVDYLSNQRFRRDLFVKGPLHIAPAGRKERLLDTPFMLLSPPADIPMKLAVGGGEINLQENIYRPLIEAMADKSGAPRTVRELQADPRCRKIPYGQIVQGMQVLCGTGFAHTAQPRAAIDKASQRCKALNDHLLARARVSEQVEILASPVTGIGIPVLRFQQLFLLSMQQGARKRSEWTRFAWDTLQAQGQRLVKAGKAIDSPEENLKELEIQAAQFETGRLPVLKALGIA